MAAQLQEFGLSGDELKIANEALIDALSGTEAKTDVPAALEIFRARQVAAQAELMAKMQKENAALLEREAAREGAEKSASGMIITHVEPGSGDAPAASDTVKVHYRGALANGEEFDSSYERGEPALFNLGQLIPCMQEGLMAMKVGGKSRLICPPDIAYGETGAGGAIPPNAVLVFEVDLLSIEKK